MSVLCHRGVLRIVFLPVVRTSVTWIWVFVSQWCGEDGEGVLRIVFRPVVRTYVTWIWCFVSQGVVKIVL